MISKMESGWAEVILGGIGLIVTVLIPFFSRVWKKVALLEQWRDHHIEKDDRTHDDIKADLDEIKKILNQNHQEDIKGRRRLHEEVGNIDRRLSRIEGASESHSR